MATELWMPGDLRVEVLLTGADTGDAFCLLADYPQPGWSLPPHRHLNESETIYVIEGALWMEIAGARREATAGEVLHVQAGTEHSGGTLGDQPCRRLVLFAPAGIERFFLEAGTRGRAEEHDPARLLALAEQYGWSFSGT